MKRLNESELTEVLALHAAWLGDPTSGRRLELSGIDLSRANLQDTKIQRAVLKDVDLRSANLRGASFFGSEIGDTNFTEAVLDGADFADTSIDGARFERCSAHGAVFAHARASRATFDGANLEGANFAKSDFRLSSMRGVMLNAAHLLRWTWAEGSLNGCNLSSADLTSARFREADLRKVDLTDTVLSRTGFVHVHLCGAHGLPLIAERLGVERLDFSAEADDKHPGTVDTLRDQLGGGPSKEGAWGSATMLERYQAFQVSNEPGAQLFSIERRADGRELIRIEKYEVSADVLEVGYRLMDPRFYHPGIPERLIFGLLIADLTQHEHKGQVVEIEYTNLENDYRTYQTYS